MTKKWPIVLIAAATAACAGGAGNDGTTAGNAVNATNETYEATPPAAANAAGGNESGNAAIGNADAARAYRASGTEPFWSLTMTDAQMVYDSADGPDVTVATPEPRSTRTGPIYETPEMTVWINQVQRCPDTEGPARQDVVRVTIGAQEVTGCGRGVHPR